MAWTKDCLIASTITGSDTPTPLPAAARAPARATSAAAWPFGTPDEINREVNPLLKADVTMAPSRAIPNTPPISRLVLVAAEATPAFAVGTDPITAAVMGDMVMAIPVARTRNAGRITVR